MYEINLYNDNNDTLQLFATVTASRKNAALICREFSGLVRDRALLDDDGQPFDWVELWEEGRCIAIY